MRFRTITAATMEAAMAQVRTTLGPGAIILNSECGNNGNVTLRVAVEHEHAGNAPATHHAAEQQPEFLQEYLDGADVDILNLIGTALAFHRAPQTINAVLLQALEAVEAYDPVQALAAALETRYGFAPLASLPVRPVLLMGPAGAGKTVTAAKLAARSVLAGHKTVLITTDLVRTGGANQLAEYAGKMKVPLYRAADATGLTALLEVWDSQTCCIIDTTGTSPYNLSELRSLKNLVMAIDCDPVLVLPAGGDSVEACEIVNLFSGLGARGLIITKLDVTRRLGSILSALEAAAMVLHHVSITPYVANGLAPINAAALARLLLEDPTEHESFIDLEYAAQ